MSFESKTYVLLTVVLVALTGMSGAGRCDVVATFDTGLEGWTFWAECESSMSWQETGGNPGGYLHFDQVYNAGCSPANIYAPASYLGSWTDVESLSFDHKLIHTGYVGSPGWTPYRVKLTGGQGDIAIWEHPNPRATTDWVTLTAPLIESAWQVTGSWESLIDDVIEVEVKIGIVDNDSSSNQDIDGIDNIILMTTGPGEADTFEFSDGNYESPNWEFSHYEWGAGGASSVTQSATSGNPDHCLNIDITLHDGASVTGVGVLGKYLPEQYDPSQSGAITSLDYHEDVVTISMTPDDEYLGSMGPCLWQDGEIYAYFTVVDRLTSWQTITLTNLTANDFWRLDCTYTRCIDTSSHPDFSKSGGPIHFGFMRRLSTLHSIEWHGIADHDNWKIAVHSAGASNVPHASDSGMARYLVGNFPNPFNPRTTITFELPRRESVSLRVFDVASRLVKTLIDSEVYGPGRHEEPWRGRDDNGRKVASGTYFYQLQAGGIIETKRMVLIK